MVLAVQNGQYRFPQNDKVYSQGLRDLIAYMLVVDKSRRPNIHEVGGEASRRGKWSMLNSVFHSFCVDVRRSSRGHSRL